jgi:hypothetical protein
MVLAPRLKKRIPSKLGGQFATLVANVVEFITWGQTKSPKCSNLAPKVF